MRSTSILIIDDDMAVQRCLAATLAAEHAVHLASSGEEGLTQYERLVPDLVLLDVMLPQMSGLAVLRRLKRMSAALPVVMMTAYSEVQTAVQAIKLGAADYLQKPIDTEVVRREVTELVARTSQRRCSIRADIIGESPAMRRVWRLVEAFGPTDVPVLLQGETGTGKAVIAEALHRVSRRAQAPFVAIDCATIPDQLAESELFGYEDGAFTGAGKKKRGRVAFADRGTLFLDEIGTLTAATQAKLLTLLEQQSFLPLGARHAEPVHLDVRFISATNMPLQRAAGDGTFRADLFHRLNGVTIELPPLRERGDDIGLLAQHYVEEFAARVGKSGITLSAEAFELIRTHTWPGNIRELQRVLSAAVVLADSGVTADDLPEHIRRASPGPDQRAVPHAAADALAGDAPDPPSLNLREIKEWAGREAQKRVILELQKRTNINRQELAKLLGVDPKTLRSRLKEISADH